jgi:hypothetical protein
VVLAKLSQFGVSDGRKLDNRILYPMLIFAPPRDQC